MVFSSTTFLFAFLPFSLAVYFALRSRKARNVWLLAISLVFYAWGEPVYVLLMIVSIVVNWLIALRIGPGAGSPKHAASPSAGLAGGVLIAAIPAPAAGASCSPSPSSSTYWS